MESIFRNPAFRKALEGGMDKHEMDIIIGDIIREKFQKPLEIFPEVPRKRIMECLVATCSREAEIHKVLRDAGFEDVMVSIMNEPTNEIEKEAMALCQAIGGTLTRKGLPCMIMEMR